jgi:hypothetical protein
MKFFSIAVGDTFYIRDGLSDPRGGLPPRINDPLIDLVMSAAEKKAQAIKLSLALNVTAMSAPPVVMCRKVSALGYSRGGDGVLGEEMINPTTDRLILTRDEYAAVTAKVEPPKAETEKAPATKTPAKKTASKVVKKAATKAAPKKAPAKKATTKSVPKKAAKKSTAKASKKR